MEFCGPGISGTPDIFFLLGEGTGKDGFTPASVGRGNNLSGNNLIGLTYSQTVFPFRVISKRVPLSPEQIRVFPLVRRCAPEMWPE